MKFANLILFLCIFLAVTFGMPFILVTFLPTVFAILGSFGTTLIVGIVLWLLLSRVKEAQATTEA